MELWSNATLWEPVTVALLVQIFKFLWEWARTGAYDFQVLVRSGGMPSSHTALVSSLATAVGIREGLGSTAFALAVILAVIVMYDARGIRQESGKQARILNQIMREFFSGQPISEHELKELLGHTSTEVIVGGIVGVVVTLIWLGWLMPPA